MADYINKDILCQAYIHIDPVPIDKEEYEQFKTQIQEYISTRGKFFIYEDVDTNIELKDGSLKIYATILGALYIGIAQYGSFRSGVDYLASDVKRLSEIIVSESLYQSKSRHDNVVRVEARIGVVGSIKKAVDEIDYIKTLSGQVKPDNLSKRMSYLTKQINKIMKNLKDPNDVTYIKENLLAELNSIPSKPIPLPKRTLAEDEIIFYREERKRLLSTCKKS